MMKRRRMEQAPDCLRHFGSMRKRLGSVAKSCSVDTIPPGREIAVWKKNRTEVIFLIATLRRLVIDSMSLYLY